MGHVSSEGHRQPATEYLQSGRRAPAPSLGGSSPTASLTRRAWSANPLAGQGDVHAAAMAEVERLKPIANGAYWRNKILARQPAIDAIKPTLAD